MYRTIFEIGPIGIHSYGLMLTIAFFFGLWYISRRGKLDSLAFEPMLNIAYILIFAGLIGGRLSYVLLHLSDFSDNPWSAINPFQGTEYGLQGSTSMAASFWP
jgi:prolipoprotein diacylglyceryltransferase